MRVNPRATRAYIVPAIIPLKISCSSISVGTRPFFLHFLICPYYVNGIIKTADYGEIITAIYGGEKYPLMAVMDIPYEL